MRGAGWVVLALVLLGFAVLAAIARSQDEIPQERDPAVMLARSCVSERGWRLDTNDCAAIVDVIRGRMMRTREGFALALRELAPHLHGVEPLTRRPWLQHLHRDGRTPAHWSGARWTRRPGCGESREGACRVARRDDWLATLAEADRHLASLSTARARGLVCATPPSAWGSEEDIRRRAALGRRRWVEVDCGEPRVNHFGHWVRLVP